MLSEQDQTCEIKMKSRSTCGEKAEIQVCQKQPLVELVYGPFKGTEWMSSHRGAETGAFV